MLLGLIFGLSILQIPSPSVESVQLGILLDRAVENARRYTDAMRNLTAEETRITELYDDNGKVERRRRVLADLIVHEAPSRTLAEFRRIREVDGKPVKDGDTRLNALTRDLSKTPSAPEQVAMIARASSQYDLDEMQMWGMSLNQAWPLEDAEVRRTAVFSSEGLATIYERKTLVFRFELPSGMPQDWRTPEVPQSVKPARVFARGRIWIDADTAEIWRYEAETMIDEHTLREPAVWDRMEFYYSPSSFGVPTPQKIVWISNARVTRQRGQLRLSLKGRVTAEYGPFKRYGAEIKIVPVSPQ